MAEDKKFERYVRILVDKDKEMSLFIIADENGKTLAACELPRDVSKKIRDFLLLMFPLTEDVDDMQWDTVIGT
jgi:hypothetical protein